MAYQITDACIGCGACAKVCPVFAIEGEPKSLHVVNPRRCVECGVCGRICPKGAVQDPAGAVCAMVKRAQWPKPQIDADKCSACGVCVNLCTAGALRIAYPEFKGDLRAAAELFEPGKCVACGLCVRDCPLSAVALAQGGMEA